jgi:hypothetical protein
MCLKNCGATLSVLGLAAVIGVFATQSSTGSSLPAASGMTLATVRGVEPATPAVTAETPAAVDMNAWQETAIRRGSVRRL